MYIEFDRSVRNDSIITTVVLHHWICCEFSENLNKVLEIDSNEMIYFSNQNL